MVNYKNNNKLSIIILISGKSKLMISYLLLLKVIQILISKIKMAGLVINLYYLGLGKVKKLKMNKIEFWINNLL